MVHVLTLMSTGKRLSSANSRIAALSAARGILLESGPQAVTLKAVGQRIGRTHANLLHHFGSAAELQKALASDLANSICKSILDAVNAHRAGSGSLRGIVDLIFDAYGREGGGALVSWMLASGNHDALDPVIETTRQVVMQMRDTGSKITEELALSMVLMALGDALIGGPLSSSFGVGRDSPRAIAEKMVAEALAQAA